MDGGYYDALDRKDENVAGQFEGKILIAMPSLSESLFERSIIYVCAHSEDGAMGFQVNKNTELSLRELIERTEFAEETDKISNMSFRADDLVRNGGPVEEQRGFVLHSTDCEFDATVRVSDTINLTSNVEILRAIMVGEGPKEFSVCLGYSGWGAGQLESEIAESAWLVFDADDDMIYMDDHAGKYNRMLNHMGINPAHLTLHTGSA